MGKKTTENTVKYISDSIGTIALALKNSKLEIEKTEEYTSALKHVMDFYDVNEVQAWMLSLYSINYFDSEDLSSLVNMAKYVGVGTIKILRWVEEIKALYSEKKYIKYCSWSILSSEDEVPVSKINARYSFSLSQNMAISIINNAPFVPPVDATKQKKNNVIGQISYLSGRIEKLDEEDSSFSEEYEEIVSFEKEHKETNPIIASLISHKVRTYDRWFLYGLLDELCSKGSDSVSLQGLINTMYKDPSIHFDGTAMFRLYREMMDNKHILFKNGWVTFTQKGNLSDAEVGLTWKGKKLLLGKDATLFTESFYEKDIIKNKDIFEKKLFYSEKNDKDMTKLTNALQDKNLKDIQKRLKNDGLPTGINILLYGLPGTGKTESVMQIAKATGRDVIHIDNSELRSCWYGDSEKIVKKVFTKYSEICETYKELNKKVPILLFNEADAILSKRVEVGSSSTAKVENNIQNILLEEMENMKGIMIATTNLLDNLDTAFERRFLFKIKFDNPSFDAKKSIWSYKLPWMNDTDVSTLAKEFDFSGGQIDNISRKIAITEILEGNKPSMSDIKEMCNNEKCMGYTSGRIGFDI